MNKPSFYVNFCYLLTYKFNPHLQNYMSFVMEILFMVIFLDFFFGRIHI